MSTATVTQLIERNDAALAVRVTPEAEAMRESALQAAAMVGKVDNDERNAVAIVAQVELKRLINRVEADRKEVKGPVLDFGRLIDQTAKDFIVEPEAELKRVSVAVDEYATVQLARQRAAENATRLEQEKIEQDKRRAMMDAARAEAAELGKIQAAAAQDKAITQAEIDRQTQLAQAATMDAMDAVNDKFGRMAAEVTTVVSTKPEAQSIREELEFEVVDVHVLYRHAPHLVDMTPRRREIKEALQNGMTLPGVTSRKVVRSRVITR